MAPQSHLGFGMRGEESVTGQSSMPILWWRGGHVLDGHLRTVMRGSQTAAPCSQKGLLDMMSKLGT